MKRKTQFSRKHLLVVLIVVGMVLAGMYAFAPKNKTPQEEDKEQVGFVKTLAINAAKPVFREVKLVLTDIIGNNLDGARDRIASTHDTIKSVRRTVKGTTFVTGSDSQAGKKLGKILKLLDAADMALMEIALPATDLLEEYPISELKVGDGFSTKLIGRYLDFAESVMPKVETVMQNANSVDLKELDTDGEVTEYLDLANKVMDIYHEEESIFSMIRSMIGAEEDRLYVIAVQNSSEVRASGGFPGSIGTMRIRDGVLTLGDFQSVTYMLSSYTPRDIQITGEERALFGYLSGIQTPRDADLCPDFERVGHIWASAYEEMNKEPVAGVISMTPHIVKRVLAATETELELFDGLVLNGDNAMEVLLHDIYFKYFGKDFVEGREKISDELFADAAKKTMKMLADHVSITQFIEYVPILKDSVEDRTLMVWMKDESEQRFITRMGWSGGLNADPQNPAAGIYYNCIMASKMGWYFRMDTAIGERTKNEDGSYTYPVTVTFTNDATEEEMAKAGNYIVGDMNGSIRGAAYFFAPAGGVVSDFDASNGQKIQIKTYNDLELGFMDAFILEPNVPITICYLVTTAPGVETSLVISRTPTARE